jgi:hypothetical protein
MYSGLDILNKNDTFESERMFEKVYICAYKIKNKCLITNKSTIMIIIDLLNISVLIIRLIIKKISI